MSKKKTVNKLGIGMFLLAVGGLVIGVGAGYFGSEKYLTSSVLKDMQKEGYVLTTDATATADDIVSGKKAYVNGTLLDGTIAVVNTSDATATSEYIVAGKTAVVRGELVVGTMVTGAGQTVIPTTSQTTIMGDMLLSSDLIIEGDANLIAENIKKGVTIFGVAGTYDADAEHQAAVIAQYEADGKTQMANAEKQRDAANSALNAIRAASYQGEAKKSLDKAKSAAEAARAAADKAKELSDLAATVIANNYYVAAESAATQAEKYYADAQTEYSALPATAPVTEPAGE